LVSYGSETGTADVHSLEIVATKPFLEAHLANFLSVPPRLSDHLPIQADG
jgi:hypothetical protein